MIWPQNIIKRKLIKLPELNLRYLSWAKIHKTKICPQAQALKLQTLEPTTQLIRLYLRVWKQTTIWCSKRQNRLTHHCEHQLETQAVMKSSQYNQNLRFIIKVQTKDIKKRFLTLKIKTNNFSTWWWIQLWKWKNKRVTNRLVWPKAENQLKFVKERRGLKN